MQFLGFDGALTHLSLFSALRSDFPVARSDIWGPRPRMAPWEAGWKEGSVTPAFIRVTTPRADAWLTGLDVAALHTPGVMEKPLREGKAEQEEPALLNTAPGNTTASQGSPMGDVTPRHRSQIPRDAAPPGEQLIPLQVPQGP